MATLYLLYCTLLSKLSFIARLDVFYNLYELIII